MRQITRANVQLVVAEWPFLFPPSFFSVSWRSNRPFAFFIESQRMSAEINSNWREIRYTVLSRIAHLLRRESVDVEILSSVIATRRNTRMVPDPRTISTNRPISVISNILGVRIINPLGRDVELKMMKNDRRSSCKCQQIQRGIRVNLAGDWRRMARRLLLRLRPWRQSIEKQVEDDRLVPAEQMLIADDVKWTEQVVVSFEYLSISKLDVPPEEKKKERKIKQKKRKEKPKASNGMDDGRRRRNGLRSTPGSLFLPCFALSMAIHGTLNTYKLQRIRSNYTPWERFILVFHFFFPLLFPFPRASMWFSFFFSSSPLPSGVS